MREPRGISLPWSRAPKAARGNTLTVFVAAVTALLSCFLAGSAVLISSAAGGAATDYQSALDCPDAYGPVFSRTSFPVANAPAVIDTVRRQAAAHGFPAPIASLYTGVFFADFGPAPRRKVTLGYRDGGLDQVQRVRPASAPGLWVGDDLTRFAPVRPGDPVAGGRLPPVGGVYHALTVPLPRWWCSQQRDAAVYRLANDPLSTIAFASDPKTFYDAVSALTRIPQWSLVSAAPVDRLETTLLAAGIQVISPASQDTALDALPFYVVEWTFSFVTVLGGVLGVVAVLGLFVAVEVRRRQNALAGTLVLRMGMSARALFASHLIELGALAGLATVAGVACGVTAAGLAVPGFDPVRWLAPRSALPDQTTFVVSVVAVALVVVLAAGRLAVRSVRTATTAELLRG